MCEAESISRKSTRYAAIQLVDAHTIDFDANMKTLYDAASVLRKALGKPLYNATAAEEGLGKTPL